MKIVFTVRDRKNFVGGPAVNAVRLLTALRARGHEIYVLGLWVGKEEGHAHLDTLKALGFPVLIRRKDRYTEDGVRWILERIAAIEPDVFVADLSVEGCFAAHWLIPAGIPVVNTVFSDDQQSLGRAVYFSGTPNWRVSGHFVYGSALLEKLQHKIAIPLPMQVIHGLQLQPSSYATPPAHGTLSVVYAGRLVEEQKATGAMLRAFVSLCKKHPDWKFHLIGDGTEEDRNRYLSEVSGSDCRDQIIFHGILHGSQYLEELSKHHILVLLSDYEGVPGAVIDGMSAGLVPVCLRYPGIEEVIIHRVNGIIVDDRETALELELSDLATNPQRWQDLSNNAMAHVQEHFDNEKLLDRYQAFLTRLCNAVDYKVKLVVPEKIRLPLHDPMLFEDRRKPSSLLKLMKKFSFRILFILLFLSEACVQDHMQSYDTDRNEALERMKLPYLRKGFDTYHLDTIPDAAFCLKQLTDQGVFTYTRPEETMYMAHLDSFLHTEMASFEYSRFLVESMSRLWSIAENYRGKADIDTIDVDFQKLLAGIMHYGKLELDRPGSRFQHKYSDFQTAAIAINMYFCLFPLMEKERLKDGAANTRLHAVYQILTAIGLQSWTVPLKYDETDEHPFQLARFSGHTWWITGNMLEFRPVYQAALMMHAPEMIDIIAITVDHAISQVSVHTADTSFWREGLTADGSAWSYGRQNRPWAYSFRGARAAVQRMDDFKNTPWEIPMTREKVHILMHFLRNSAFYFYKGYEPPCIERQNFNAMFLREKDIPSVRLAKFLLDKFADALTSAEKEELRLFLLNASPDKQRSQVEFDPRYYGTQYFYCQDDLVRKNQDYYVLVNMASVRVDGNESAMQYGDVYNFYAADGAVMLMRSGDEYRRAMGAFQITAHPGVTSRYGDENLKQGRNLMGHCSRYNYAGGTVTERGACAAFIFEKMQGMDKYRHLQLEDTAFEKRQDWLGGIRAYKSYFWFDDDLLAMGAGITNLEPEREGDVHTTLEQTVSVNSSFHGMTLSDTSFQLPIENFPAHAMISNNNFLYRIYPEFTEGEISLTKERRSTRWEEYNIQNIGVEGLSLHEDIFQVSVNHGRNPSNSSYAYGVYCGNGTLPEPPVILRNDTLIQAAMSPEENLLHVVFYQTDTLRWEQNWIAVSAPCILSATMAEGDNRFTVCDTRMDTALNVITISTNIHGAISQVNIELPGGLQRGNYVTK